LPGCDRCPRREYSPRAVPWEFALPWNVAILHQSVLLVRDDRGLGCACARAVGAGISHGVGTSVTVRTRNACGNSAVGRRRSARPAGVRTMPSRPSTPRRSVCAVRMRAVSVPEFRRKPQISPRLGRRVVTQQKFFAHPLCERPGCYEPAPKLGRNQAHYCGPDCCQAVRRVQDRERKWVWRGTFRGRRRRAQEYQAARARRCEQQKRQNHSASATPPRAPPRAPPP
jgi:hypothetical protein